MIFVDVEIHKKWMRSSSLQGSWYKFKSGLVQMIHNKLVETKPDWGQVHI